MKTMGPGLLGQGGGFRHQLWQRLRGHLFTLLTVSFFINLLALATPVFVLQVYDRVVFYGGLTTLQGLVIGMLLVLVFDAVLKLYRARFFQSQALHVDIELGDALYTRVFGSAARELETRPLAYWQQLFRDAATVRNVVSGAPAALLVDLPFVGIFFIAVVFIAPPLWPVITLGMVAFLVVAIVSERVIRSRAREEQDKSAGSEQRLADLLSSRVTLQASGRAAEFKPNWDRLRAEAIGAALARGSASDANRVLTQSMTLLFTVVMTTVGALAIIDQQMTIGSLIAANMLGSRLVGPLAQLVDQWRVYAQFNQVAERLEHFLAEPVEQSDAPVPLEAPEGRFTLEELTYRYQDDGPPALDGLEGTIGPRGLHLIVGRNGSGKSTLLRLLAGDYTPSAGSIRLDSADLRPYSPRQRNEVVGVLQQRPELLNATVFENVVYGRHGLTTQEIESAAKAVGLHDQVGLLPEGYETWVAEGQRGVSGGLLQKIALARVLAGPARILILDEPTTGLDREAEARLAELLKKHATVRTVVVASHSPALLQHADTLMVLERGKVAIAGPAEAVRARLAEKPGRSIPDQGASGGGTDDEPG